MDAIVAMVCETDAKDRQDVGEKMLAALPSALSSVTDQHTVALVNGFLAWLKGSNFKACLHAIHALQMVAERIGPQFRPFVSELIPVIKERLGDSKDQVRDATVEFLQVLMEQVFNNPQPVIEALGPTLTHKNPRVREKFLECLEQTLVKFGATQLSISKQVPQMVVLLTDQNEAVREQAMSTLTEVYRHVGERVRTDISRMEGVSQPKIHTLFERFDVVRNSGMMLAPTDSLAGSAGSEERSSRPASRAGKRTESISSAGARPRSNTGTSAARPISRQSSTSSVASASAASSTASSGSSKGGIDEAEFEQCMYEVDSVNIGSQHDLEVEMKKMNEILGDDRKYEWETRVVQLKRLRGIVAGSAADLDNFVPLLRGMGDAMILSIRDLRSGVSREACITVAQIADALQNGFEPFVDTYVPALMRQVVINVKIMADSANIALKFIAKSVSSMKFPKILLDFCESKAVAQRRTCSAVLVVYIQAWVTTFGRNIQAISRLLATLNNDADLQSRALARQAYWKFSPHFPDEAQKIIQSLDANKQRALLEDRDKADKASDPDADSFRRRTTSAVSAKPTASSASAVRRRDSDSRIASARPSTSMARPTTADSTLNSSLSAASPRSSGIPPPTIVRSPAPVAAASASEPITAGLGISATPSGSKRVPARKSIGGTSWGSSLSGPSRVPQNASNPTLVSQGSLPSFGLASTPAMRVPGPGRLDNGSRIAVASAATGPRRVQNAPRSPLGKSLSRSPSQSLDSSQLGIASPERPTSPASVTSASGASFGDGLNNIFELCKSKDWSERLQGVSSLKGLLRSARSPSSKDMKRLWTFFIRQLSEPHNKVLAAVLDALCDFIVIFKSDCPAAWVAELLTELMNKMGADMVTTTHSKALYTLELIRDSFPVEQQLSLLFKLIVEAKQNALDPRASFNNKSKVSMLEFIGLLLPRMAAENFENVYAAAATDTRTALQRVIDMANEPKSGDLRKFGCHVVTELFELHPRLFSRILSGLPLASAEAARRILSAYIENWEARIDGVAVDQSSIAHDEAQQSFAAPAIDDAFLQSDAPASSTAQPPSPPRRTAAGDTSFASESPKRSGIPMAKFSPPRARAQGPGDADTSAAAPPNGHFARSATVVEVIPPPAASAPAADIPTAATATASASAPAALADKLQADRTVGRAAPLTERPLPETNNANTRANGSSPKPGGAPRDRGPNNDRVLISEAPGENASIESTLQWLIRLSKEGTDSVWEEQFDGILAVVLELMADPEPRNRDLALRALRELLRNQTRFFDLKMDMVARRLLDRFNDIEREVLRSAEEAVGVLAAVIPIDLCVSLFESVGLSDDSTLVLASLKLLSKVVKRMSLAEANATLPQLLPGILKGYKSPAAEVRKAVVFALVELHAILGEQLMTHLTSLTSSQMKLLNIYIKRAEEKGFTDSSVA
eukprot:m.19572 g.19572  ORF g.19572 m.19572 type:complete len:1435 (+) comp8482_c0_seq1:212-4516(+)